MTIAVYLALYIVRTRRVLRALASLLFTTDMASTARRLQTGYSMAEFVALRCVCSAYTTGLLFTTVVIFERKDIVT